jgi:type I restriction enzyme, S subunit
MTTTATYNKSAWLGNFPAHWQVIRIKYLGNIKSGDAVPENTSIEKKEFEVFGGNGLLGYTDQYNIDGMFIIIGRVGAYCGNVRLINEKKWISDNALILSLNQIANYEYVHYALIVSNLNSLSSSNAQPLITGTKVLNVKIPVPPVEEQNKIVEYIKTQSQKINHFIAKKQQFIALLKEQRQSVINEAVTKGINKKVKLKDSGIKWLGNIPEHWELKRLKNVCVLQRGHDLSVDKFINGEVPVFGSNGIIGYHNKFTTKAPCITIGRSGSVGEINFVENDFWAHNTCLYVKENFKNDWNYLYFLLSTIDIKMVSNGSAVPTLDRKNVHSLYVAYPPLEEQTQIVNHIKTETTTIDTAIAKTLKEIELIKEYKEAMIAEAVMGKVKMSEL